MVLSVLDALVQQALGGDNEPLLRKWQAVRLVRRSTANTSSSPATTTQSTPATTSQPTQPAAAPASAGGSTPAPTAAPVSESSSA